MAIEFMRDEESPFDAAPAVSGGDHTELREAIPVAIRSTLPWLVVGAVALVLGMLAMKRPILAANQILLHEHGYYWSTAWMPPVLFGIFGLIYGGLIGWRISSGSGLAGAPSWFVNAVTVVLLAAIGCLAARVLFGPAMPLVGWISLGFLAGGGLLGACIFAFWAD